MTGLLLLELPAYLRAAGEGLFALRFERGWWRWIAPIAHVIAVRSSIGIAEDQSNRETSMTEHRFRLGQKVRFTRGYPYRLAAAGDYQVVGQLPDSEGELRYRIKSTHEPHERVVKKAS